MLRLTIFICIIIILFPIIYKINKRFFKKFDEELNNKTVEDYADDVNISKQKLKEQLNFEEKSLKQKQKVINKIKGENK